MEAVLSHKQIDLVRIKAPPLKYRRKGIRAMAIRKLKTGERGWLGLLAYIIVIDSIAWRNQMKGEDDETMSLCWGRWLQLPRSRAATGLAWAFVTAHLFLSLPIPGQKTLKSVVVKTRPNSKVVILTMPLEDSDE